MGPTPCVVNQSGGCGQMRPPRTCSLSGCCCLLMVGVPSSINDGGSSFWKMRTRVELFGVVVGLVCRRSFRDIIPLTNWAFVIRTPVPANDEAVNSNIFVS